jgi:hypothetical protein
MMIESVEQTEIFITAIQLFFFHYAFHTISCSPAMVARRPSSSRSITRHVGS